MKIRPTSVTIISWILVAVGGISLITSTLMLKNAAARELMAHSPMPLSVQYAMLYVGLLVTITSGLAMLKGQNWGRLLYVVWGAFGSLISVTTSPMKTAMIPGFVVYLVIVFFLFRPRANQYFGESQVEHGAQGH